MSTLYVVEPDARLEKEADRLLVTRGEEVLFRARLREVTGVVLVGRAGVTTPALHALLAGGVPLLLVGRNGRLLGRLLPPTPLNLPARRAQYGRDGDADFALRLARAIVGGKLRNQRVLARRLARREARDEGRESSSEELPQSPNLNPPSPIARPPSPFATLQAAIGRAARAADLPALRGIEGAAAAAYFRAYRAAFDPAWGFIDRNRRPPRDPVNALLSLGYSWLTQAMMTALETVGLDPYLGYYHSERYGRPALALDLVEEFRAPVVDSLTLTLINRRLLRPGDFEPLDPTEGVLLTTRGLRVYARQFGQKLESTVTSRAVGRPLSYRKLFEVQARALARAVSDDAPYVSFRAR